MTQAPIRGVLLTRKSPFQIYCANTLYNKGIISGVVFENGFSFSSRSNSKVGFFQKLKTRLTMISANPKGAYYKLLGKINYDRWYGDEAFHQQRILKENFEKLL